MESFKVVKKARTGMRFLRLSDEEKRLIFAKFAPDRAKRFVRLFNQEIQSYPDWNKLQRYIYGKRVPIEQIIARGGVMPIFTPQARIEFEEYYLPQAANGYNAASNRIEKIEGKVYIRGFLVLMITLLDYLIRMHAGFNGGDVSLFDRLDADARIITDIADYFQVESPDAAFELIKIRNFARIENLRPFIREIAREYVSPAKDIYVFNIPYSMRPQKVLSIHGKIAEIVSYRPDKQIFDVILSTTEFEEESNFMSNEENYLYTNRIFDLGIYNNVDRLDMNDFYLNVDSVFALIYEKYRDATGNNLEIMDKIATSLRIFAIMALLMHRHIDDRVIEINMDNLQVQSFRVSSGANIDVIDYYVKFLYHIGTSIFRDELAIFRKIIKINPEQVIKYIYQSTTNYITPEVKHEIKYNETFTDIVSTDARRWCTLINDYFVQYRIITTADKKMFATANNQALMKDRASVPKMPKNDALLDVVAEVVVQLRKRDFVYYDMVAVAAELERRATGKTTQRTEVVEFATKTTVSADYMLEGEKLMSKLRGLSGDIKIIENTIGTFGFFNGKYRGEPNQNIGEYYELEYENLRGMVMDLIGGFCFDRADLSALHYSSESYNEKRKKIRYLLFKYANELIASKRQTPAKIADFLLSRIKMFSLLDISTKSIEFEKLRQEDLRRARNNAYYNMTPEDKTSSGVEYMSREERDKFLDVLITSRIQAQS